MMILLVIAAAFVLFGFFAGSEMAYLSCNKLKLRHLTDEGNRRAQIVMRFYRDPKRFLTTVLIGTNLMHVTVVALATYAFERYLGVTQEWIVTASLAPVIIIFAETIPKDWFRHKADDFIYRFAPALEWIDRLLSGGSRILIWIMDALISMTTAHVKKNPFVTRDEFRYVIEESAKGGVLREHEKHLINAILNLSSKRVDEVMIPLAKFPKTALISRVRDVKEIARKTKAGAVLVYEEIPSLVVGIVYVFDLLFEEAEEEHLSKYLRSPLFVTHDTSLEKALFLLQMKHATYATVINPEREVIGTIRLENLIQL